jgi:hypothetical protein
VLAGLLAATDTPQQPAVPADQAVTGDTVIDGSGQKYDATITGDGFGPSLNVTELAKGQRTTSTIFTTYGAARAAKTTVSTARFVRRSLRWSHPTVPSRVSREEPRAATTGAHTGSRDIVLIFL